MFKGGLWKPQTSIEYRMCLAETHHWFAWNVRVLLYSPNTCFLESHPGPKRLESHPGPKKLSVSLLMEVQINIEMYFSRSPPPAPIFFGGGGIFFNTPYFLRRDFQISDSGLIKPSPLWRQPAAAPGQRWWRWQKRCLRARTFLRRPDCRRNSIECQHFEKRYNKTKTSKRLMKIVKNNTITKINKKSLNILIIKQECKNSTIFHTFSVTKYQLTK